MNKRIQELYIQTLNESENIRWNIEDAERFAELIVRECAGLFDRDEMELTLTERDIHNIIKEHFGVDE